MNKRVYKGFLIAVLICISYAVPVFANTETPLQSIKEERREIIRERILEISRRRNNGTELRTLLMQLFGITGNPVTTVPISEMPADPNLIQEILEQQ